MRFRNPSAFTQPGTQVSHLRQGTRVSHLREAASETLAHPPAAVQTRDRWPFLNEPDCPAEMHALVGQRISAWHEYSKLYKQLRDCQTLKDLSAVCGKLLNAYLDNQQAFAELDYYQRNRKVLGRHPVFKQFKQNFILRGMTTKQLFEERKRTRDNIWRVGSELKKGDKPHLDAKRRAKLKAYELKLQEINRLLGDE